MGVAEQRCRLAATLLSEPQRLWGAVASLLDQGIAGSQICLVALHPRMSEARLAVPAPDSDRGRLEPLAARVEDWPELGCGKRLVASSGRLLECLKRATPHPVTEDTGGWLPARHFADLRSGIERGGLVLVASAESAPQQSLVARTLLRESTTGVRTYEFLLPGEAT